MNYATYTFYKDEYKGALSEPLFNSLIVKASREIDKNVNRDITQEVIDDLSDKDKLKLQSCACELVDTLNTKSSSGVTSYSIDGVSKIFKTDAEISAEITSSVKLLPDELTRLL